MIIERTSAEVDQETQALFHEIEPLIQQGYSICNAVKTVKNLSSVNTNLGWYRRIKEYTIKQGYPADVNCYIGRPRKDKVKN